MGSDRGMGRCDICRQFHLLYQQKKKDCGKGWFVNKKGSECDTCNYGGTFMNEVCSVPSTILGTLALSLQSAVLNMFILQSNLSTCHFPLTGFFERYPAPSFFQSPTSTDGPQHFPYGTSPCHFYKPFPTGHVCNSRYSWSLCWHPVN